MSGITGLKIYVCPKCNWADFFETKTCPRCYNEIELRAASGKGTLATFTVIRYPPVGFERDAPYVVALVNLQEGLRVIGRVNANPEELQVDKPVHFVGIADGALHFAI